MIADFVLYGLSSRDLLRAPIVSIGLSYVSPKYAQETDATHGLFFMVDFVDDWTYGKLYGGNVPGESEPQIIIDNPRQYFRSEGGRILNCVSNCGSLYAYHDGNILSL